MRDGGNIAVALRAGFDHVDAERNVDRQHQFQIHLFAGFLGQLIKLGNVRAKVLSGKGGDDGTCKKSGAQ